MNEPCQIEMHAFLEYACIVGIWRIGEHFGEMVEEIDLLDTMLSSLIELLEEKGILTQQEWEKRMHACMCYREISPLGFGAGIFI